MGVGVVWACLLRACLLRAWQVLSGANLRKGRGVMRAGECGERGYSGSPRGVSTDTSHSVAGDSP